MEKDSNRVKDKGGRNDIFVGNNFVKCFAV